MLVRRRRGWEIPEREATPEEVFLDRRRFLGATGAAALGCALGWARAGEAGTPPGTKGSEAIEAALRANPGKYPAPRNPRFVLDRPVTDPAVAARYNNFYEFGMDKEAPAARARELTLRPWTLRVGGLVEKPLVLDVDDIVRGFPLEERLYRHRCVEAWSMAVPWTGFPLRLLLERARPLSSARYVRFVSFFRPEEAIGQRTMRWYPWPYFEGLGLAEATHELALLVTGIYGKPLPPQHGAPVRIVVPWKYGYKSAKSIVEISLVAERPPTFWNTVAPREYDFTSNVNPAVPHPRWSQAEERLIGTNEVRPTLPYNGYGEWVAAIYR